MMHFNPREDPRERTVAVTGASGFVGRHVVNVFRNAGWRVRALVRNLHRSTGLRSRGVSLLQGEVTNSALLKEVFANSDIVVHAAADTTGTIEGGRTVTVAGSQAVVEAAAQCGVSRIVYFSSCSVYSYLESDNTDTIREETPLDSAPERRGAYSWAKTVAEQVVRARARAARVDLVVLRPGIIYGPDDPTLNPMVGALIGRRLLAVIGRGNQQLPLVHVEDVAEAVWLASTVQEAAGGTFNIVHPERVTKSQFVKGWVRCQHPGRVLFRLPYGLLLMAVTGYELAWLLRRAEPRLTRYRFRSSQRSVRIDSRRALEVLRWSPRWSLNKAIRAVAAARTGVA